MADAVADRDRLGRNGGVVRAMMRCIAYGGDALKELPAITIRVINDDAWRDFLTPERELAHYDRFEDFCRAPELRGLDCDLRDLKNLCRENPVALDAIDKVTGNHQGARTDLVNNGDEVKRPRGNTRFAALRALRHHRPDLHAQVLAGELTPHRAMVLAGLRRPTMMVPADDPVAAWCALVRRFGAATMRQLVKEMDDAILG